MESAARSLSLFAASVEVLERQMLRAFAQPEMLQAFAVGLHREAASFAAGRKDGEEGADFRPLEDWSPERLLQILRTGDHVSMDRIISYALGRGRVDQIRGVQHAR